MSESRPNARPNSRWTEERCHIAELINTGACPELSIARAWVEPGVITQLHSLSVEEWYVIESGQGRLQIDGAEFRDMRIGDSARIAQGQSQRIENTGENDLVFLCICTPRFVPDSYTSLE